MTDIRINNIKIKNYKGINNLELSFPRPIMRGDSDIRVIGGENGIGKSAVAECCAMLLLALEQNKKSGELAITVDSVVSSGKKKCTISGDISAHGNKIKISLTIERDKTTISFTASDVVNIGDGKDIVLDYKFPYIVGNSFLFFTGGRNSTLSDLNLNEYSHETMNKLLLYYANCEIAEYPIIKNLETKKTFNIDGLSSGQREAISITFRTWSYTMHSSHVVIIDDIEAHLNAQWHRKLIRDITELAPLNQYIITTHSSYIMGAVDSSNRAMIER